MNNVLLTNQQLEFLKLLLLTYEYSDDNFDLYNKLEYKVYKTRPQFYQDKLTTIGG